eukprot:9699573-Alexandrium_andersonii.AAC.1
MATRRWSPKTKVLHRSLHGEVLEPKDSPINTAAAFAARRTGWRGSSEAKRVRNDQRVTLMRFCIPVTN